MRVRWWGIINIMNIIFFFLFPPLLSSPPLCLADLYFLQHYSQPLHHHHPGALSSTASASTSDPSSRFTRTLACRSSSEACTCAMFRRSSAASWTSAIWLLRALEWGAGRSRGLAKVLVGMERRREESRQGRGRWWGLTW